ncbi:MAG: hypothetical protein ACKO52_02260 [Sediminibacterium sp.]
MTEDEIPKVKMKIIQIKLPKKEDAVHGSDSNENAAIEGNFFFSGLERF